MSPIKRYVKTQAKARQRRRLKAQERLERDRRQAQHDEGLGAGSPSLPPAQCAAQTLLDQATETLGPGGIDAAAAVPGQLLSA